MKFCHRVLYNQPDTDHGCKDGNIVYKDGYCDSCKDGYGDGCLSL